MSSSCTGYLYTFNFRKIALLCNRLGVFSLSLLMIFTAGPVIIYTPTAHATPSASPPDISGTYTGNLSGSGICAPPPNEVLNANLTFTIAQNGTNFSGDGTFVDLGDGGTGTFQFSGTVDAAGNVYASNLDIQSDVLQQGQFMGVYSNNTLQLSFDFADIGPPNCIFNGSGTFTSVNGGGIVVNPEITPSSILTAPLLLNTFITAITGDLNARIGDVLRGLGIGPKATSNGFMWQGHSSGLNAGESITGYGVWGSYSYSDFDNDFVSTAFDGHRHNFLAGFDIAPWENTVAGISVGYEDSDIDTGFNQGNQEADGFTVAPYFGYLLNNNLSIDVSGGYSRISSDQFRTDPGTGVQITSSPDAHRWFGAANLNAFTTWDNWILLGRIGALHARNTTEFFIESNGAAVAESRSKLSQFNIGGEAAYSWGEYEPFVRLTYEHDYSLTEITVVGGSPQPSNDNDNFLVGAGLRFFKANGLTGNLEWNKRLGRDDYDEDSITATLRMDF